MKLLRVAAAALPLLLALQTAPVALADGPTASVTINDNGFSPVAVSIPVGGTVSWINQGAAVHTATSTAAAASTLAQTTPAPFDSGGLGSGQGFSFNFTLPGTYIYTSAPDCLNGNNTPGFTCTGFSVIVGGPAASGSAQPASSIGPQPVPSGVTVEQHATVGIFDNGFSPAAVAVTTGGTVNTPGSVTFVNKGTTLHTAVSGAVKMDDQRSPPELFDTGGLAPGEEKTVSFINTGTYAFNSAPDCLNGANNPAFDCGAAYTLKVIKAPVGANAAAPAPPFSGQAIYVRDDVGFDPPSVTIKAGQTVTWLNLGKVAHSVASDSASTPFDSGGLGVGNVFSVTFTTPGTYHYHSSTEPIWSGNQILGYQFNGTVVVEA
ncbi:MAG TPA: plastocyanin/azurin family copper-binding protein [Chloroflexota bacterium]|nr:plastocyanin/azurin family copper-binding protein [Chloroflexota bacterium]